MAYLAGPEHNAKTGNLEGAFVDEKANHPVASPDKHLSPSASEDDIAEYSRISESKILRKLDLHLLPGVCILYLLSFLDRSNVGNARLEGLTKDLDITPNEYLTGLTLFFVGYIMFEVLCELYPSHREAMHP